MLLVGIGLGSKTERTGQNEWDSTAFNTRLPIRKAAMLLNECFIRKIMIIYAANAQITPIFALAKFEIN